MTLLIIPDIFGPTPALDRLARDVETALADLPRWSPVEILDTYGNGRWFDNEAEAYAYFTEHLGIPAYADTLNRHLAATPGPCNLLGFSAGASAVWHLAGSCPPYDVCCALCFYGSQIRHEAHLVPEFPIHLVFPESEPHFNVDSLMAAMTEKPRVTWEKAPGQHGFMNRLSQNYNGALYHRYTQKDVLAAAFFFHS